MAPRNLLVDVRRLVASAATRRDYGAIARILGDAEVDLAWLAAELGPHARCPFCGQPQPLLPMTPGDLAAERRLADHGDPVGTCEGSGLIESQAQACRAHSLAIELVRLGVEPENLIQFLPPATIPDTQRAQLRRERFTRARHSDPFGRAATAAEMAQAELQDCYQRHGEVLAERDATREPLQRAHRILIGEGNERCAEIVAQHERETGHTV